MALPKGEKLLPPLSLFSDAVAERNEVRGYRGESDSIMDDLMDDLIGAEGGLVVVKPSENPGKPRRRTITDTCRRMIVRGLFRRDNMPFDCSILVISLSILLTTRRYFQFISDVCRRKSNCRLPLILSMVQ